MNCRGCDTRIESDTYCKRCLEEIESLIRAEPFVWPEWANIAHNVMCGIIVFLLIALFFLVIGILTPDTKY